MVHCVLTFLHVRSFYSPSFRRCDCKEQLKLALEFIQEHGGAVIYLQQEGRGIGLANKVAAYALQDMGMDTVDANLHLGFPEDCRKYGVIPTILKDMGIGSIQLMTNNPRKVERLNALGVDITDTVPILAKANFYNRKYLETKQERMNHSNFGHILDGDVLPPRGISNNGAMAPRRPKINNIMEEQPVGLSAAANALEVSLLLDEPGIEDNLEAGVTAHEDGYCFGRKSVEDAIAAVARGEMVVVVDDMDRENEGDFIMAADACTPLDIAKIVRYSSGVICVGMEGKRMDELKLPAMVTNSQDPKETAFSVTVDATPEHGMFPRNRCIVKTIVCIKILLPDAHQFLIFFSSLLKASQRVSVRGIVPKLCSSWPIQVPWQRILTDPDISFLYEQRRAES